MTLNFIYVFVFIPYNNCVRAVDINIYSSRLFSEVYIYIFCIVVLNSAYATRMCSIPHRWSVPPEDLDSLESSIVILNGNHDG